MKVTAEGQTLVVEAPHSMTPTMKTIPGMRYDRNRQVWTMPLNLQALAALKQYTGHDDPFLDLKAFTVWQEDHRIKDAPIKGQEHLYPFQAAGVRFLAHGKGVLMADEMGTGKTVQALPAIDLENAYPALVVCPNSLKHNWAKEVGMWCKRDDRVVSFVIEGNAKRRRQDIDLARELSKSGAPVVVIINYEALRLHSKQAPFGNTVLSDKEKAEKELNEIAWQSVVVDEAHRIKSPKASQTRAVWGVSETARYRFALTGTPIVNNPDDLWSIMRFVAPDEYPSRQRFRDRYCLVRPGWHGGLENLGLRDDVRSEFDVLNRPRFIRRTKSEVLPELPEKIVTTQYLPMTKEQQKAYGQMVEYMMADIDDRVLVTSDPLVLVGKLRFIASAMPVLNDNGDIVALGGPSNKLGAIQDILDETQDALVVYSQSRKLIEFFARELDDTVSVTGGMTPAQRQDSIDRFQGGDASVFLATTGAGAEGLTLTRSNRLVVAWEDWSNVANKQAHDRIHRIGQERGVEVITLVSKGTIEEAVSKSTGRKEDMLQQLVQDKEALMRAVKGRV